MSAHSITSRGLAGRKIPQGTLTPIGTLLFSASEPGAWYDPSDLATLFQDEAGTAPVTAVEQPVGRMLDKSGRGNHAAQATTTRRPVYSRRVNLLTKTEQFDNAGWVRSPGVTVESGYADPLGGATGCLVTIPAGGQIYILCADPGGSAVASCYLRLFAGAPSATISVNSPNGQSYALSFDPASLQGAWSRLISVSNTFVKNGFRFLNTSASEAKFYAWGASLTLAADAHLPYQRVNTGTDYDADPSKFPAYHRLDGVDDSRASATGGGGTAGFFLSQAITVLGGAGTARTLFSDAGTNTGYIVRLNTSNQLELAAGNGTAYTTVATSGTLAVGTTNVIQAWDDGTTLNVKIGNGATASIARPVVSAGTAGYTMGQDNGASTGYFNGRIHSTIYRKDSGLTQVQREAVAVYQRQKARIA